MTYFTNQDEWQQVPFDRKSPNYRGDLLPEWKKKEIRNSIAKAQSILNSMSEIERTEFALRNSRLNPSIDWSLQKWVIYQM